MNDGRPSVIALGEVLDAEGRYVVREVLGEGAFGIVYRVFDERWGLDVALKTMRRPTPELRQWLKAEYRSLRDIVHPNLIRLHELHVDDERCFFTMDVVPGGVMFTHRLDFDRDGEEATQRAAIRRVCRAGHQLADALQSVHAFGKCHRDVKPTNVLLTPTDQVVLLDFGMAGHIDRTRVFDTARGAIVGTLPYLAPEQYNDPRPLHASDWYSMGVVLHQTLTGHLPFEGDFFQEVAAKQRGAAPPSARVPAVPEAVDRVILGLLEPDPLRRMPPDEVLAILLEQGDEPGARSFWPAFTSAAESEFVARERELETLRGAHAAVCEGRFVIVEVAGPSGIGKTALMRRFLKDVSCGSVASLVFEARCDPHESIPYKAFDAVVDDLTRYWIGLDARSATALCPSEGFDALTLLFPELRRVAIIAARTGFEAKGGDLPALRERGFQALKAVLAGLCSRQPVVLWVDDIQWADADSVALIESVFGLPGAPPLLLVLSRRPEEEPAQPGLNSAITRVKQQGQVVRIDMTPLGEEAALLLARAITEREGGGRSDRVAAIVREAAGVPYLLSELAHFVAARRTRDDDARSNTTASSLMHERLRALSPEDRALVELAALSGAALPADILLLAAGTRDRSRLRDLCILRLLRWTSTQDAALQIYHDRLREFVVAGLAADLSVARHLALLMAMEELGFSDVQRLMAHSLSAGDRVRTSRHAVAAARQAEAALAFDQAARLYKVALDHIDPAAPRAELHELLAEAMSNAGQSSAAAPEFERAARALASEAPEAVERMGFLRRRAGEHYLKAGHFQDGLRLMEAFLAEAGVTLPKTGNGALAVSAGQRARLYLRGFDFQRRPAGEVSPVVRRRLDDLWAATTALSMMDPVRADGVGLTHFHEALRAGDAAHVARSLGYEAAFAALIGGAFLRGRARDLLRRNREALEGGSSPYDRAFYQLGAGSSAFFHSQWDEAIAHCDAAAECFRKECRGAEYEAAVSVVFGLQARGQAGRVSELVARIPAAIREADSRGDLFAANNYRAGFHALGRIAAGQIADVQSDLRKVVETWQPGFYQMHAYHRVFAGVAADLYVGDPRGAVERIERDWPELEAGLFLYMELPAMELRWARARALLALAGAQHGAARASSLSRVRGLLRAIEGATVAAARPHAAILRAGVARVEGRSAEVIPNLRAALEGYAMASMAMHREVSRWNLARLLGDDAGRAMLAQCEAWMRREGVLDMALLTRVLAPGLELPPRVG